MSGAGGPPGGGSGRGAPALLSRPLGAGISRKVLGDGGRDGLEGVAGRSVRTASLSPTQADRPGLALPPSPPPPIPPSPHLPSLLVDKACLGDWHLPVLGPWTSEDPGQGLRGGRRGALARVLRKCGEGRLAICGEGVLEPRPGPAPTPRLTFSRGRT